MAAPGFEEPRAKEEKARDEEIARAEKEKARFEEKRRAQYKRFSLRRSKGEPLTRKEPLAKKEPLHEVEFPRPGEKAWPSKEREYLEIVDKLMAREQNRKAGQSQDTEQDEELDKAKTLQFQQKMSIFQEIYIDLKLELEKIDTESDKRLDTEKKGKKRKEHKKIKNEVREQFQSKRNEITEDYRKKMDEKIKNALRKSDAESVGSDQHALR